METVYFRKVPTKIVTYSVGQDVVKIIEEIAEENKMYRSNVVDQALRQHPEFHKRLEEMRAKLHDKKS